MIKCPHSVYFFRGNDEDFRHFFVDEYEGEKRGSELTASPNPYLNIDYEGKYFRVYDNFKSNSNFTSSGVTIKAGSYVQVVRRSSGGIISFKFELFKGRVAHSLIDWGLVPLGRPMIAPPQQKLHVIDVPGSNGVMDISNSLTRYPVFENRQGTLQFAIHPDLENTPHSYERMLNFLQGVDVKMILEDDPEYYYSGRVYVDSLDPKSDGNPSEVTLGYDLFPYKQSIYSSLDDWLWDTFDFEDDVIESGMFANIRVDEPVDGEVLKGGLQVDDPTKGGWTDNNSLLVDFSGYVGQMPVFPQIIVTADSDSMMYAQLLNTDLYGNKWVGSGIDYYNICQSKDKNTFHSEYGFVATKNTGEFFPLHDSYGGDEDPLSIGKRRKWTEGNAGQNRFRKLIFCEFTPESKLQMRFKGCGEISIFFRKGKL